jgi:cellulose synthase/poly-beta-1,6-N-acetylglucosamine synthase-like glycosyltransferase
MIFVFLVYFLVLFIVLAFITWVVAKSPKIEIPKPEELPELAIVVAARNESKYIENCLNHLLTQNYPGNKLKIYVGEDQSTDDTLNKLESYQSRHPLLHVVKIQENWPGLQGKQNVLAQVIDSIKEEYILVTDADTQVSPNWAQTMVKRLMLPDCGVVTAPTVANGVTLFARLQGLDWIMGVTIIFFFVN